ncbi:16S rRNA (guanine(527)-N(7))-methyltransferase RsmG [Kocuria palustris]|nr:16S rRNA methyltransferase [Kocuria palustris]KUG54778.1 16S rRNA (guanine(527)-N(7))-methyltransferase RsmG [Kocuria palustris]MBN6753024.1 16S rRNA (guanine(527)-N(7))-methyltransferase RsmG [Kocuria palustris]MBN6758019.1 16S rRNA (guanine(527)-N(7))-methyltransferase RsmG [Kocuria palustris]MBN6763047.1 16S rRNA (guanine(527)-N(7))-methyltransferase RsmG [Kocuria palustris]
MQGREAEAAQSLFGDRLELAQRYVEHLASSGIVRGLIGPREAPRLWGRHVLNCAVVEALIPQDARVADVGSGAGLPGLCLAIARPDLELTLIEPLERRVTWLNEIVQDLQLENVQVLRARGEQVEELPGGSAPDVVTARAVSALGGLLDFTLPLLQGSGELLALKGRSAQQEIDKARKQLKRHRVAQTEVLTLGSELLEEPTTVVRVVL